MGVDIDTWRARVGCFIQPRKWRSSLRALHVPGFAVSVCLRLVLCLALLVILGGDLEMNPGPPKSQSSRNKERNNNLDIASNTVTNDSMNQCNDGVRTRQRTLSSFSFSQ